VSFQPHFQDFDPNAYERRQQAESQLKHLKLVRAEVTGTTTDAEQAKLGRDFAETTDSTNLLIAHLARASKVPPVFSGRVRDFIDAIIGLTAGSPDLTEIPDEVIAGRMGCSDKTIQNARRDFRKWADHATLIEVRDNYRTPEGEAHAHRYRCRVTALAAEATLNARCAPGYDADDAKRRAAFKDAALDVADAAEGFPPREAKKRRQRSDSELVISELGQAVNRLQRAADRQPLARTVSYDALYQLRDELLAKVAHLEKVYGLEPAVSTLNTNTRMVETVEAESSPDGSGQSHRMEAEDVPDEVEKGGVVEIFSTKNESTESTTYENRPAENLPVIPGQSDPPPDELTLMFSDEWHETHDRKLAEGKTSEDALREAWEEVGEFEEWNARRVWGSIESRLRGGADGNTN
jgi:hypothetical protein